jgi:vancomycin resistance protein YoaR
MDEPVTAADADEEPSPSGGAGGDVEGGERSGGPSERPPEAAPARRRGWVLPVTLVPLVLLVVLIIAWAVDTSSGGVARNVRLAGQDISNVSEAELSSRVKSLADAYAGTKVEIRADAADGSGAPDVYTTTAGQIGLTIDQDRTVQQALDEGNDAFVLLRPFAWVGSFVSHRDAPVAYRVGDDQVATSVVQLEGADRVAPTEPTVQLVDGRFQVVPGKAGTGIEPADVAAALPAAAARHGMGKGPIVVQVRRTPIPPLGKDADAEQAASGLEALVKDPVTIQTPSGNRTISPETLRTWVTLTSSPDGTVAADLDPAKVDPSLRQAFASVAGGPVDAHFTIQGGKPVVVPERPGKVCCGPDAAATIITALRAGDRTVDLQLVDGLPTTTKAELDKLGIVEEVGQPLVFGPTTHHACCEPRVSNIHRIADTVRGSVIQPGATFSINRTVGIRTAAKGYLVAGAIVDGEHGDQVGGGISQFGTTLFNAALFAGLDFGEYQSHSLYFTRYPRGREATLSYPHPDLQVKNTTPYGVLIWPEYNDTTLTVHLYSTHYVDVQVGDPYTQPSGRCTKYISPRTRTYLDGRVVHDTVFARYRPAEGVDC